jgi:hypothetical protein
MNIVKTVGAVCALAMVASSAFAVEAWYVVCTTDMVGNKTYDVREKAELAELKKQAAAEARLFPKAVAKLQKEWTAPEAKDLHQFKWQGQRLKPRSVKEMGQPYPTREKALVRADKLTDKELGLDDPKKGKPKKKLSEKEVEKLDKEHMRAQELEELAAAVQKEIEAMAAATAAPAPAK